MGGSAVKSSLALFANLFVVLYVKPVTKKAFQKLVQLFVRKRQRYLSHKCGKLIVPVHPNLRFLSFVIIRSVSNWINR